MAGLQVQGASGSVVEAGAFAAEGLHSINKPHDYGALGHYAAVLTTGTMAAGMAANGELVQMRWVSATNFCAIQEIQVLEFRDITTAFAAGPFNFQAIKSTAWSADGTGGGVVSVTDPQLQLRPAAMGASLFSTGFRLATTAALGAGTKTLDTVPFGGTYGNVGGTPAIADFIIPARGASANPTSGPGITLWKADIGSGEHPVLLTSNGGSTSEGISIRGTVPATGTWIATFLVKWAELAAF